MSLVIEPGQTVALVGHSGCGKSTSVGLLTRLYEAEAGRVTLDGCDVRELNIEWLRNTIGIVQQVSFKVSRTYNRHITSYISGAVSLQRHRCWQSSDGRSTTFSGADGLRVQDGERSRFHHEASDGREPCHLNKIRYWSFQPNI